MKRFRNYNFGSGPKQVERERRRANMRLNDLLIVRGLAHESMVVVRELATKRGAGTPFNADDIKTIHDLHARYVAKEKADADGKP